ncbi:hypothetical protein CHGG_00127 [Chaetomium globosum CBS 148.51]|uniref:Integrase catalytic domain-containing protein n=1 Tax=Chaetomium globosum (strain ATCC 6205 / CBS 148.51 / DSM 1962 / NBRC 6347 / NRRL 1970) TaxID=306901 RepID=Q2HI27_CHAGB|nr:uncharacterized protein CHGG_00127 [Chaetomium globosum CBS 148.51]EAQ91892.1 hypothetical protein CHGG_00127 [Chaetomium globosum CBS 148.51]
MPQTTSSPEELDPGSSTPGNSQTGGNPLTPPIPQHILSFVDHSTWGDLAAIDEIEEPTPKQMNSHIYFLMEIFWASTSYAGRKLWGAFKDEFDEWTAQRWDMVPDRTRKHLRAFLSTNGVIQDLSQLTPTTPTAPATASPVLATIPTQPQASQQIPQAIPAPRQQNPIPQTAPKREADWETTSETRQDPQTWPRPSEEPYYAPRGNAKHLADLAKLYSDDMKYGGGDYDILDTKMAIFRDLCNRIQIPRWQASDAFPIMLKDRALRYYYDWLCSGPRDFDTMVAKIRGYFENEEQRHRYLAAWRDARLINMQAEHPDKSKSECLELLINRLALIQRAVPAIGQTEDTLRMQLLNACRGVAEARMALFNPAPTFEGVRNQLQAAIGITTENPGPQQFNTDATDSETFWTDRTYRGSGRESRFGRNQGGPRRGGFSNSKFSRPPTERKCFVCGKPGCWSTTHPIEDRKKSYESLFYWHEGSELEADYEDNPVSQFFQKYDDHDDDTIDNRGKFHSTFFNDSAPADAIQVTTLLANAATHHFLTKEDPFQEQDPSETYTAEGRYSATTFRGIMPDSGAAQFSTAGQPQFQALQRQLPSATLDTTRAGEAIVKFGYGTPKASLGTTTVPTPLGTIDFHVMETETPFLLCLRDMDRLGIKFDNLRNLLQRGDVEVPVTRKWGHPWLQLTQEEALVCSYLTDGELRRLHRRFGHPSVARLYKLLKTAGHPVEIQALELIAKVCHHCQMHSARPARFKFTLHDDCEFNYEVIMDIFYVEGNKPVLHLVDAATAFNAARFLPDVSTKYVWEALRLCWIDVYQGPPDYVVTDAGKQFASTEFRQNAKEMAITVKEVPIEAHNSIGKVERYHAPVRRAYEILRKEDPSASPELSLQMAVKAVNDTAGPNGLVPTLLVFGAYPRMTHNSAPSPTLQQRAQAIKKATDAVRRLHAERKVWREKSRRWEGPFTLIGVHDEDCIVETSRGAQKFRSTVVKPYYEDPAQQDDPANQKDTAEKPAPEVPDSQPRSTTPPGNAIEEEPILDSIITPHSQSSSLRADGKVTTPGEPFEESSKQEIESLITRGVFEFVKYDEDLHGDAEIFKSRIVNEIKGKTTDKPYEKSRLVVQGFGDAGKEAILTQSPTIQRASQRLILAIAPSLQRQGCLLWLRDITQAYVQSEKALQRKILAFLPQQIRHLYPEGTVMRVIKPLYGLAEAGTYWWTAFSQRENDQLKEGVIQRSKDKQFLTTAEPLVFNGGIVTLNKNGSITLRQKGQAQKLQLIDANAPDAKQHAAQHQEPTPDDIKTLNRRIQWQMDSQDRGLTFLPLNLETARLYVFVDGSFANNRDFTSQLGFAIILANEDEINDRHEFSITGNLIHFSSTKSKRVTRSVLASEVYGMVAGVDMAYALASTLRQITAHLNLPAIPTIVCTDSYSLYECLVKLGTTKEKRLMIDIMALRQSYERRELQEDGSHVRRPLGDYEGDIWGHQLPFGLYLKMVRLAARHESLINEHAALQLVRRHTNLPVPRALDLVSNSTEIYLLTTRIPGHKVGLCLDSMSDQATRMLVDELRGHLAALRDIPMPGDWQYVIANAAGGPCFDYRIYAAQPGDGTTWVVGPFLSENDFNQALRCGAIPEVVHRSGHRMAFTHGDLNMRNVLVDEYGRLSGVVDWENAGWFPEYWDYTKAFFVTKYNQRWLRMVEDMFGQFGDFQRELATETELWNYCF